MKALLVPGPGSERTLKKHLLCHVQLLLTKVVGVFPTYKSSVQTIYTQLYSFICQCFQGLP